MGERSTQTTPGKGIIFNLESARSFLPELIASGQGEALLECLLPSHGEHVLWGFSLLPYCLLLGSNTRLGEGGGFPHGDLGEF